MPGAAATGGLHSVDKAGMSDLAFGLASVPPATRSTFSGAAIDAAVSRRSTRHSRVVRKRPRAALAGVGDAARDSVGAREEIARLKGADARSRRIARRAKTLEEKEATRVLKEKEAKAAEVAAEKAAKGAQKAADKEAKAAEKASKDARAEKSTNAKVGEKEKTYRDGKPSSTSDSDANHVVGSNASSRARHGNGSGGGGEVTASESASGSGSASASANGSGSASASGGTSASGSKGSTGSISSESEEFVWFSNSAKDESTGVSALPAKNPVSLSGEPAVVGAPPNVAEHGATGGMSPPGKATPSLSPEGVGIVPPRNDSQVREGGGLTDHSGAESAPGSSPAKAGGPASPGSGIGVGIGTGSGVVGPTGGENMGGSGSSSGSNAPGVGGGRPASSQQPPPKAEKGVPVPGSPVGVASEEGISRSVKGRVFTLQRAARAGAAARREVSRIVTESAITAQMRMPTRREFAVFAWEAMLVMALIALLRTGVSRTLRWIHNRLDSSRAGSSKPSFPYEQSVFECLQRPLEMVSIFTVGTAAAEVLSRPLVAKGSNLLRYIRSLRELGVIFAATWFLLRWIDRIRLRFAVDKRIDKAQVDASSRVASVVTTVIAILISLDSVGVNVQTVLAFGGIGGVAIGFAGREIISNFFGGFMIFLTRPFSVGEWIRSIEEKDLNGTVEDIGWYLTRIRTWDKRPLYIPNSRFSTLIVENPSRMSNRRILHTLHLRLEDMPIVAQVVASIDQLLKKHPELDPKQHRLAYVDRFDEFSVQIWMSCYTKSVFLFDWRRIQQELLLSVYGILREHGARLATTTTRDVRPGIDPDRYGPLGASASFRNRQPATSSMPSGAGLAGAVRAAEEHLDGQHIPSIVADIESGFAEEELPATPGQATQPSTSKTTVPVSMSSSSSTVTPPTVSAPSVGEDRNGGITSDSGDGAPSSADTPDMSPSPEARNGAKKDPAVAGGMFPNANISPSAAEALEMAAAAIMAARYNQRRSDGRQSNVGTVPSTTTTDGPTESNATAGSDGTRVEVTAASPAVSPTTSGSVNVTSTAAGASVASGSGGGGDQPVAASPSAAPAQGTGESPQPSGQMKISAAPPIGSPTSTTSQARPPASPAPTSGTNSSPSPGGTSNSPKTASGTAKDPRSDTGALPTDAPTTPSSQSVSGEPLPPMGTSATGSPTVSPVSSAPKATQPAPSPASPAAAATPSQSGNLTSPPAGPATGQMNISAARPKSKSKAVTSVATSTSSPTQPSGTSERRDPKQPPFLNAGNGSVKPTEGTEKLADETAGPDKI